jgi:hypothetical protein
VLSPTLAFTASASLASSSGLSFCSARSRPSRVTDERNLDNAAKILKMHQDANLPYRPSDDGFVFSNADIEAYIGREERWQQANDHDLCAEA